jgi:hypothetical protein
MGFFDDMTDAVASYPAEDVLIEIVDFQKIGNAFNVNEEATFKVKVTNTGPLDLVGTTVRVKGLNGARLKAPGQIFNPGDPVPAARAAAVITPVLFVTELVSEALPMISGHGGTKTSETFTLKAPASPQAAQTVVQATIEDYNVRLDHILDDHSDPLPEGPPKGSFSIAVINS